MSEPSPTTAAPHKDRWWIVATIAAVLVSAEIWLATEFPESRWPWLILVAMGIFVIVMILNPRRRFRRWASACLAIASGFGAFPSFAFKFHWNDQRWAEVIIEDSPWLAALFMLGFLVCIILDFLHEKSLHPSTGATTPTPSSQSMTITGGTVKRPIQLGANSTYNEGINAEIVLNIQKHHEKHLGEKDAQLGQLTSTLAQREEENASLKKAVERLSAHAAAGDTDAVDALKEARESGDATKIKQVLIAEADRRGALVQQQAKDYIELCREIIAVSILQGDLPEAEKRITEILKIAPNDSVALNRKARIHLIHGELDQATKIWSAQLGEAERNGEEDAVAIAAGNLGNVFQIRGDLQQAEKMHLKALAIHEKLGSREGMARDYCNLGIVFQTSGDLQQAEDMYRKALALHEMLESLEGMAADYGNLAAVFQTRGDLQEAQALHEKALLLNERLGSLEGLANEYCNLGNVYFARCEIQNAENSYLRALAINEQLGRVEEKAITYFNLGCVYKHRRDFKRAREHWLEAKRNYSMLGAKNEVRTVKRKIAELARIPRMWFGQ